MKQVLQSDLERMRLARQFTFILSRQFPLTYRKGNFEKDYVRFIRYEDTIKGNRLSYIKEPYSYRLYRFLLRYVVEIRYQGVVIAKKGSDVKPHALFFNPYGETIKKEVLANVK